MEYFGAFCDFNVFRFINHIAGDCRKTERLYTIEPYWSVTFIALV